MVVAGDGLAVFPLIQSQILCRVRAGNPYNSEPAWSWVSRINTDVLVFQLGGDIQPGNPGLAVNKIDHVPGSLCPGQDHGDGSAVTIDDLQVSAVLSYQLKRYQLNICGRSDLMPGHAAVCAYLDRRAAYGVHHIRILRINHQINCPFSIKGLGAGISNLLAGGDVVFEYLAQVVGHINKIPSGDCGAVGHGNSSIILVLTHLLQHLSPGQAVIRRLIDTGKGEDETPTVNRVHRPGHLLESVEVTVVCIQGILAYFQVPPSLFHPCLIEGNTLDTLQVIPHAVAVDNVGIDAPVNADQVGVPVTLHDRVPGRGVGSRLHLISHILGTAGNNIVERIIGNIAEFTYAQVAVHAQPEAIHRDSDIIARTFIGHVYGLPEGKDRVGYVLDAVIAVIVQGTAYGNDLACSKTVGDPVAGSTADGVGSVIVVGKGKIRIAGKRYLRTGIEGVHQGKDATVVGLKQGTVRGKGDKARISVRCRTHRPEVVQQATSRRVSSAHTHDLILGMGRSAQTLWSGLCRINPEQDAGVVRNLRLGIHQPLGIVDPVLAVSSHIDEIRIGWVCC